jgi:transposase
VPSPEDLPDDIAALKRIIAEMARDAATARAEIARLKFQLARYRRAEFGQSSEKLTRQTEQLELAIEALETDQAERRATAAPEAAALGDSMAEAQRPARRPLPEHLPREEIRHRAGPACPSCGGALRRIGEDVTETLDYVPGRFKVIRHIREKLSCRACDTVVAAPAPDHAIARGRAGAGLLAHIVVSKFDDHLPLYRRAEIYARDGVGLETSTLSGWVGATAAALTPLVDAIAAEIIGSDTLHVDDTPVPVLAPGTGKTKTKTGRLWVYVRDERPFAGARPPAVLFRYSPDRKGEHPRAHLKAFTGVIHADGYAGFNELFAGRRIAEAGCWALAVGPWLLGPCPTQVLRRPYGNWLADRQGGARPHRPTLWHRGRDHRLLARASTTRAPAVLQTNRRGAGRMGGRDRAQTVAQIRTRRCLPLYALPPPSARPLL